MIRSLFVLKSLAWSFGVRTFDLNRSSEISRNVLAFLANESRSSSKPRSNGLYDCFKRDSQIYQKQSTRALKRLRSLVSGHSYHIND